MIPLDLSPYRLRAVINVPEGGTISSDFGRITIQYGRSFQGEREYVLTIVWSGKNSIEYDKRFAKEKDGVLAIVDTKDSYFYEYKYFDVSYWTFQVYFPVGEQIYNVIYAPSPLFHIMLPDNSEPKREERRAVADVLWKAAKTLRQSEDQKNVEAIRTAARLKLMAAKGSIGDFDGPSFTRIGGNLVSVSLEEDGISEANLATLKDIPDLGGVRLKNPDGAMVPKLLKTIMASPLIKNIGLEGDWVTDEQLEILSTYSRIESLTLLRVSITDKGIAKLAKLEGLDYLVVLRANVTDEILTTLLGLKNLKTVALIKTKVTPEGADKLKAARPDWRFRYSNEKP